MNAIVGREKSLKEILGKQKFSVDYYQRGYRWDTKHVRELLEDLTTSFLDHYSEEHHRSEGQKYGLYFLGSIIISQRDEGKFIVDGQQRLTSLSLLLVHIHRLIEDEDLKANIKDLLYSSLYGEKSYNIDIKERADFMDAILRGEDEFDVNDESDESVRNMWDRYRDIKEIFPPDCSGRALPHFAEWLIEKVYLVEITARVDRDAYAIFETMNDRGLSLTPTEMLKGYLLAKISDSTIRDRVNSGWRQEIQRLKTLGKNEDSDAIKNWLRSQHADSIRGKKAGAEPQDFERIGTEFHRWIREKFKFESDEKVTDFIESDFAFYAKHYARVRNAANRLDPSLASIYYNSDNKFTLQYTVLLAALKPGDNEKIVDRKLNIAAMFLDILVTRRVWNYKATDYNTMRDDMFRVVKEVRGKSVRVLANFLADRLRTEADNGAAFGDNNFALHRRNGPQVHRLLARITAFIEKESGVESDYSKYVKKRGSNRFEIEHVWAKRPERHEDEFDHEAEFDAHRDRIGGLLLLPKKVNASLQDMEYGEKQQHYLKENLLAQSLHPSAYEKIPVSAIS